MYFSYDKRFLWKIAILVHILIFYFNISLSYRINSVKNHIIPVKSNFHTFLYNYEPNPIESSVLTTKNTHISNVFTNQPHDVRVRFAPSPTGSLHIGSLRTYIYNYLFAKKYNGKLILRIDDTDPSRNVPGSLEEIISTLRWTGLEWDEGVYKSEEDKLYYQSNRNDTYKEYAEKLVKNNHAYYCFCKESFISKLLRRWFNFKFNNSCNECINLSKEEVDNKLNKNCDYAIKLRTQGQDFDDFVLVRSNGFGTYNFSSCVDDYLMNITHIIRGSDHILNSNKHKLIFELLNVKNPEFIHVPLILDENQYKLSKRSNNNFTIRKLIFDGICPLPLINYLTLLGTEYSHHKTIYKVDELIDKFTFNLTNSNFNYNKLLHLNKLYLHNISNDVYLNELHKYYEYNNTHNNTSNNNNTSNGKDNINVKECIKKEYIKSELVDIYKTRVNTLKDYFVNVHLSLNYNLENIKNNQVEYDNSLKKWIQEKLKLIMEKSQNTIDLNTKFINLIKEIGGSENKTKLLKLMRFLMTGETNGPSMIDMANTWKVADEYNFENTVNLKRRIVNIINPVQ